MPQELKKEELAALRQVASKTLLPHQQEILKRWVASYPEVDKQRILTATSFAHLCEEELKTFTNALLRQELDAYFQHASELGSRLAELGIDFSGIPTFIHALEESYTELLLQKFRDVKKLTVILTALDAVLHNTLTNILTSYFNLVRERLTEELARGRILEQAFRPRLAPKVNDLDIGVVYASATEKALIGGDFYDFFYLPDGRLSFVIGDVSGKGVEAATTAAMTKFMFRGFAFEFSQTDLVLKRLNKALSYTLGVNELVTAAYAAYNRKSAELKMAGAGHPPPFYLPAGRKPQLLQLDGVLLGALPELVCFETTLKLSQGDLLLFYTDGLVEAKGPSGLFGYHRVEQFLAQTKKVNAQQLVTQLLEACLSFTGRQLTDDLAMVCFYKTA